MYEAHQEMELGLEHGQQAQTSPPVFKMPWPKPDPDQGAANNQGLLPNVRIKQEVLSDEEPEEPAFNTDFYNGVDMPKCKEENFHDGHWFQPQRQYEKIFSIVQDIQKSLEARKGRTLSFKPDDKDAEFDFLAADVRSGIREQLRQVKEFMLSDGVVPPVPPDTHQTTTLELVGPDSAQRITLKKNMTVPCLGKLQSTIRSMCPWCGFTYIDMTQVISHLCFSKRRSQEAGRYGNIPDVVFGMINAPYGDSVHGSSQKHKNGNHAAVLEDNGQIHWKNIKEEKMPEELEVLDIQVVKNHNTEGDLSGEMHSVSPYGYMGCEGLMNESEDFDIKPFYLKEQKRLLKAIKKEKQVIINIELIKKKRAEKELEKRHKRKAKKKNKKAKKSKRDSIIITPTSEKKKMKRMKKEELKKKKEKKRKERLKKKKEKRRLDKERELNSSIYEEYNSSINRELNFNKDSDLNSSQGSDNFTVMHGDLGVGHSDVMEYHFNDLQGKDIITLHVPQDDQPVYPVSLIPSSLMVANMQSAPPCSTPMPTSILPDLAPLVQTSEHHTSLSTAMPNVQALGSIDSAAGLTYPLQSTANPIDQTVGNIATAIANQFVGVTQPISGAGDDATQLIGSVNGGNLFPVGSGVVDPSDQLLSCSTQGFGADPMQLTRDGPSPVNAALANDPIGLHNAVPTGQVVGALGQSGRALDNCVSSQMLDYHVNPAEQMLQPYNTATQDMQSLDAGSHIGATGQLVSSETIMGGGVFDNLTPTSDIPASLYSSNHASNSSSPTNPIPSSVPDCSASQGFFNDSTNISYSGGQDTPQLTSNSETQVQYSSPIHTCSKCFLQFACEEEMLRHHCSCEFSNESSSAQNALMVVKTEPIDPDDPS